VSASSPQGRFADGAASIDGATMTGTEAYGKRTFLVFDGDAPRLVHVHLGRQGVWLCGRRRHAGRRGRGAHHHAPAEGIDPDDLDEVEGRFVYGRETCGRCGTVLEHLTIGGRAIAACPRCQPPPV
jgi:formamidopyrimidine-DNA glycosylase